MFGLEKSPQAKFAFDLEKNIKGHPHKKTELLSKVTTIIQELKQALRAGANEKEFEKLNLLLSGYLALQKVLTKINP